MWFDEVPAGSPALARFNFRWVTILLGKTKTQFSLAKYRVLQERISDILFHSSFNATSSIMSFSLCIINGSELTLAFKSSKVPPQGLEVLGRVDVLFLVRIVRLGLFLKSQKFCDKRHTIHCLDPIEVWKAIKLICSFCIPNTCACNLAMHNNAQPNN